MLAQPKSYYKNLNFDGFKWGGFDDGMHFFVRGNNQTGFETMWCKESCLTNGNADYMSKHGLTFDDETVKKLQKSYRQKENKKLMKG